jgi:hypothetical protein
MKESTQLIIFFVELTVIFILTAILFARTVLSNNVRINVNTKSDIKRCPNCRSKDFIEALYAETGMIRRTCQNGDCEYAWDNYPEGR